MIEILQAKARRFVQKFLGPNDIRQTGNESLAVSDVEGERDEMSRAGIRFSLCTSAATGIAPVQAVPTTAAQWLLYMPATSPTTAFIDWIGMYLVSGTAGAGATVLGAVCTPAQCPSAVPTTSAANVVLQNCSGVSKKGSNLLVVSGATLQSNPSWQPVAFMNPLGTLVGQVQMEQRDLRGAYALGPGSGLALVVLSPTGTTPLWAPYAAYHEAIVDLE
jgi:hypothetical protein